MERNIQAKWSRFLNSLSIVSYKKGQVLLFQGEAPRSAYIIKEGIIKTYDLSVEGYEQLANFYTASDIFPLPWILGKAPTAFYYYETVTPCKLYRLPKEAYQSFLNENKDVLISELERYAANDIAQTMRLTAVLHSRARDKLINTFNYLVKYHGIHLKPNLVKINLALTHQDIANLTGLRRETVAVELNKLKSMGVIHYKRRVLYHIDLTLLKKVLNNQIIPIPKKKS